MSFSFRFHFGNLPAIDTRLWLPRQRSLTKANQPGSNSGVLTSKSQCTLSRTSANMDAALCCLTVFTGKEPSLECGGNGLLLTSILNYHRNGVTFRCKITRSISFSLFRSATFWAACCTPFLGSCSSLSLSTWYAWSLLSIRPENVWQLGENSLTFARRTVRLPHLLVGCVFELFYPAVGSALHTSMQIVQQSWSHSATFSFTHRAFRKTLSTDSSSSLHRRPSSSPGSRV